MFSALFRIHFHEDGAEVQVKQAFLKPKGLTSIITDAGASAARIRSLSCDVANVDTALRHRPNGRRTLFRRKAFYRANMVARRKSNATTTHTSPPQMACPSLPELLDNPQRRRVQRLRPRNQILGRGWMREVELRHQCVVSSLIDGASRVSRSMQASMRQIMPRMRNGRSRTHFGIIMALIPRVGQEPGCRSCVAIVLVTRR
jgi:hypothetical protein